nr:hypothetical protein [uncultured Undibacterium sp.]
MRNPFTVFTDSLHIGLSQSGIALIRHNNRLIKQVNIVKERGGNADSIDDCLFNLDGLLKENQCQRLKTKIFLSNNFVRFFVVTPPSNASRFQDCQAAAEVRFHSLFGESPSKWMMSADWQLNHPFLASAIPNSAMVGIKKIANEHHLSILKIEPQLITHLNRLPQKKLPNCWLASFSGGMFELVMMSEAGIQVIRKMTYSNESIQDKHWLRDTIQREAFRHSIEIPKTFYCGNQPSRVWMNPVSGVTTWVSLDKNSAHAANMPLSEAIRLANSEQIL